MATHGVVIVVATVIAAGVCVGGRCAEGELWRARFHDVFGAVSKAFPLGSIRG